MGNVTTIGLDLAKSVFQVHGIDADGAAVLRQRLTRGRVLKFFAKLPPCLIGIEACAFLVGEDVNARHVTCRILREVDIRARRQTGLHDRTILLVIYDGAGGQSQDPAADLDVRQRLLLTEPPTFSLHGQWTLGDELSLHESSPGETQTQEDVTFTHRCDDALRKLLPCGAYLQRWRKCLVAQLSVSGVQCGIPIRIRGGIETSTP